MAASALTISFPDFIIFLLEAFADGVIAALAIGAEIALVFLLIVISALAWARMSLSLGVSEIAFGPVLAVALGEVPTQWSVALVVVGSGFVVV